MALDMTGLRDELKQLEARVEEGLGKRQASATYRIVSARAKVEEAILREQRKLKMGLVEYIRTARLRTLLTGPFIYGMIVPIAFLDLCVNIYQFICFSVWGIPRAKRRDFVIIDRHRLGYLNAIEKLNCVYCGYANGVVAFTSEVAGRTEQYWCPIKHAARAAGTHSRYDEFLDYGDAHAWRARLDEIHKKID